MSFNTISNDKNIFTDEALKFRYKKFQAKRAFERASILGFILFGMWFKGWTYNIWMQIIFVGIVFCCFFNVAFTMLMLGKLALEKPLNGSERQRKLLNVEENSIFTKVLKPIPKIRSESKADSLQAACSASLKTHHNRIITASTPKKSDIYSSKLYKDFERKMNAKNSITDEKSLQEYLVAYENTQKINNLNNITNSNAKSKAAILLGQSEYQLAVDSKKQSPAIRKTNSKNLQTDLLVHISSEQLTQYVLNLRHWISVTILKPLINEIDNVNNVFERLCLSEFRIGETGLEKLRNLVNDKEFVSKHVHRLPLIMDYLEICLNQIYLLQNLRRLSDGAWLSNYTYKMDPMTQFLNLPKDAIILFQCVCKYLDRQLQPFAEDVINERPFFDKYVILNKNSKCSIQQVHTSVCNSSGCAILFTNCNPPRFNLVTNETLYFGQYGFNNFFHVFLGFLIYINRHCDGMLEGVSLGRNGINILWTIGESDCK